MCVSDYKKNLKEKRKYEKHLEWLSWNDIITNTPILLVMDDYQHNYHCANILMWCVSALTYLHSSSHWKKKQHFLKYLSCNEILCRDRGVTEHTYRRVMTWTPNSINKNVPDVNDTMSRTLKVQTSVRKYQALIKHFLWDMEIIKMCFKIYQQLRKDFTVTKISLITVLP